MNTISSAVYNQQNQSLYYFYKNAIHSLDFSKKFCVDWEIWRNNLDFMIQDSASYCMVDRDRFIAVINANKRKSYLFAMNETKLSIQIGDCCSDGFHRRSIYHDIYHKIITAGHKEFEWYDINKDQSMIFSRYSKKIAHPENIWYSPFNPNILYCATTSSYYDYDKKGENTVGGLFVVDLRDGFCENYEFVSMFYKDPLDSTVQFVYLPF